MKILVLNSPKNIQEVLSYLPPNTEVTAGTYNQIEIIIKDNKLKVLYDGADIALFDYVWITGSWSKRDLAKVIAHYLHNKQRKFTVITEGVGVSKLVDIALFATNDLPQPNTYYSQRCNAVKNIDRIIDICGLPVIAKNTRGSRGKGSFLANTAKELLKKIRRTSIHVTLMFQSFIPNDFDWGIVVADGKCVSAEKSYRTQDGSQFLNNTYMGATEVFTHVRDIPKIVATIAQKAHSVVSLDWGRADIIQSSKDSKLYLLEVNRSPRMTSNSPEVEAFGRYLASELAK